MSGYLGVGFGAISITSFTDVTARRKLSAVDSVLKVEFTVEATTISDTTNIETKLIVTDTTEMTTQLTSAGLSSISNIVAPTAVAALAPPPPPTPPPPPAPDVTKPRFLATPKATNILGSSFEIQFKLDSDVDVHWLIIEGKTSTVMQNILTPAMVINFDPANEKFAGMTIAAAGVVSGLAANTVHTIKSSDAVTSHTNIKDPAGSIGFTIQPSTDYAIILVAKELSSQNTHEEFQRYASSTTFVDDEKAKIFDVRTLGFSIKDGKSTFTLSEEDVNLNTNYIVQVTKDTESGVTLGALDCVSIRVTASTLGQLTLSTASNVDYVENEILIPAQCGNSIKMEVHFKPKPNEILDGDRTITLTHKVATATGQFASFDGATLKALVSVTLTDNDKGALELDATSKEFNEGSSLPLELYLSAAPPSGDKITVSLAKGSQDEGVEVSPSKVVFCCLETSTLIQCTTTATQKNCCICQKVIETDADVRGYLWSYKVPIAYTSTKDDGEAAANKIVSLTATAASALTAYNGVTTTVEGITVMDIHSAGARMSPAELELTEGGTDAKVTIELTSKPNAGVTLKLEDSSTTDSALLSFSPSTVTFSATSATDWKTPKEVRVTYPRDYKVKDVTKKINVRLSGTTADTTGYGTKDGVAILFLRENLVTVSVTDVDTAAFVFTPSAGTFNEDGGIFSYAVKLATIPDGDVTVTPQAVGNLDINPPSITLTPETARTNALTFQVKSKERDYIDIDGSLSYVIKHLTTTDDEVYERTNLLSSTTPSITVTVTDADTAGFTFSKAIAGTANLEFDTIQESTQETSYVYWLRLKTKPEEAVTFTVTEDCTADLSLTYSNCGIFTIRLDDSVTTTHTFAAKTDHVTTETALKVTLTIPADTHETGLHPPPRSSNLKISVASGDARYASLPPHTLALTIKDKLYVEKLEEPIDTTAAATEETTVNNSDGVVLVKIPANAIPQEILERPGLKIDVETAIIEAEEGSNILAIEDATKYETKTSIIEYKMTSSDSTADLSVSFASPVELTIPLDSADCLAEGAYCQCMRADSKDATSEWQILDGISTSQVVGTNDVIASCFTNSFSLYTVAAVKPTVTISAYGEANDITFDEENSKVTLTPVTIASVLTLSGTASLDSISAKIVTNYFSRQDYLTIKCTLVDGVTDNWAPAYSEVTAETQSRTCSSGVYIDNTRNANLKATFDISNGILTISGVTTTTTISVDEAQKMFRTIQYVNSEKDPWYGTQYVRDVTFTVSEKYTGYTTTNVAGTDRHAITVVGYNNAPVMTTSTSENIYVERANAKNVAQLLTIADDDSTQISSAKVTLSPAGTEGDELSYSGATLSTTIQGLIQAGTITFTGIDTIANYQQALRAVTFKSTSYNPTVLSRTITFEVTDVPGAGLVALTASTTRALTIQVVNDPPEILGLSLNAVQVQQILLNEDGDQASGYQIRVDDKDSDTESEITYEINCVANKGEVELNSATGAVSYTPNANANGEDSFFAIAKDSTGQSSVPFQFSVYINPLADDPVAADKSYNFRVEWEPKEFDFPVSHPDAITDEEFASIISFIRLDGGAPVGTLTFTDESVSELGVKQGKSPFTYSISQSDYDERVVNADGTRDESFTDTFSYIVVDANQRTAKGSISIVVKSDADEASTPPVVSTTSSNFELAYNVEENIAYSGVFYAIDSQTLTEDLEFLAAPPPSIGNVSFSSVVCGELTSPLKTAGVTVSCPCNQYEACGKFVYTPDSLYYGYDSFELKATDTNGDASQSMKVYVYIEPVNNRPTLACEAPRTMENLAISGTSATLLQLSSFASSHPLCNDAIIVGDVAIDSLEDIRVRTRAALTYEDGVFVPASLSPLSGLFAELLTLSNALETRAAGEIPLMFATKLTHDWYIPMGGETARAGMEICAGLGNDATSCVASAGCQLLLGVCVSASWGSPDHVVEAAIALLSYDMDEERGFNKQVSGSPVEPAKSNGFLSEPVLLAPLNEGEMDDDVQIFVANTDGTKGARLTWTSITEEKTVTGGVIIVQMPSKRRGTVAIRWRATDAMGLKRPVAPDYATVNLITRCAPGHRYMDWWWDTSRCFACSPGWFNQVGQFDQTSCKECPPGEITANAGQTECAKCPAGSFQPGYGESECLPCFDGAGLAIETEQLGSSSLQQCVCPVGYWTDYAETSASELWSKYKATDQTKSYFTTETSGTSASYEDGSLHVDIVSHTEFADVGNDAIVPQDGDGNYVSLKDPNGDAMKCVGHVKQTCAALITAGLSETSLGNGVCNPALNVPECGWDCGDCCRQSCLPTTVRSNLPGWSSIAECSDGGYSCIDPRFAAPVASVYKANTEAPFCKACAAGASCNDLNQQFPLPTAGWWVDPTDGSRILQCIEPAAMEACPALTSIDDVRNGVCGISKENQLYMGEACSECSDGKATPYFTRVNAFRSNGRCKKCPDVPWLPYLFGALLLFVALPLLNLLSKMQDGFGAVNIIVGFTQVVSVFRKLELAWPQEILDLLNLMSVVNLNLELFSIDCFVVSWNWTKKFFLVNIGPLVLGSMFLVVTLIVTLHNKIFLPYVYAPIGRCFGVVLEEDQDPTLKNPSVEHLDGKEKKKATTADENDGDEDEDDIIGGEEEEEEGGGRRRRREKIGMKKRFLTVKPPDQTEVFARAMHSAFLLFMSWSYMQLVNINVEYFDCVEGGDGRSSLDADPAVQCYVGVHEQIFPLVVLFMIIYTLGIPFYLSVLLFTHRRLLRKRDVIDVRTRPLSVAAGQLLEAEQRFGFVFRRYESSYSWWELVYIFRKFALVVTPVFFQNVLDQCLMTMLVLVPGMLGVVRLRPYDKSMLDIMEWIASTAAFFILFAGFLFYGFGEELSDVSMDTLTWITVTLLSITYVTLVIFVIFDVFPHLNLVTLKMRNRIRKIFGYPQIEKMSQKEVNMNRSMRRERAGILRRLKGNAALILGKNTAVTFLKECRRLPLDHKYIVDPKLKQKALPTLLEVLQALEECTVGFRLASDREISEILGTEVEEFDYSQKLVGTFIGELRDIFNAWRLDIIRLKQNLRKSAEGDQDKEYVLQIRRRVISDRLKKGSLTPPAIGEGCLDRYNERFLYDQFVLRCERDLFLEMVILFEFLRLKEAVAQDPFFETLMGRNMLLNTSPLLLFSREGANVNPSDEVAAKMLARGALYYDQLKFAFRQRVGEGVLDLKSSTKSPLSHLSNLMIV